MNYTRLWKGFMVCALCVSLACMKDVDLGQMENIALTPEIEASLLHYNITQSRFEDPDPSEINNVVKDTVRLERLDDEMYENLDSVEIYFRHNNTFSQDFSTKIHFLSEAGDPQFSISSYSMPGGSESSPSVIETIEGINHIKNSALVVVELEVHPNGDDLVGELNFASKGLFKFNF